MISTNEPDRPGRIMLLAANAPATTSTGTVEGSTVA